MAPNTKGLKEGDSLDTTDWPGCLSSQAHMVTPSVQSLTIWLQSTPPCSWVSHQSLSAFRHTRSHLFQDYQSQPCEGVLESGLPALDQTQAGKTNQYTWQHTRGVLSQGTVHCQGLDGFYPKSQRHLFYRGCHLAFPLLAQSGALPVDRPFRSIKVPIIGGRMREEWWVVVETLYSIED